MDYVMISWGCVFTRFKSEANTYRVFRSLVGFGVWAFSCMDPKCAVSMPEGPYPKASKGQL